MVLSEQSEQTDSCYDWGTGSLWAVSLRTNLTFQREAQGTPETDRAKSPLRLPQVQFIFVSEGQQMTKLCSSNTEEWNKNVSSRKGINKTLTGRDKSEITNVKNK